MQYFHGKYGNLSTLEAAELNLKDVEEKLDLKKLNNWNNDNLSLAERYDAMRLVRQIEGLQKVILKNRGSLMFSNLPLFYKPLFIKRD